MKKKFISFGFLGLAAFIFGCSDDAPLPPVAPPVAELSSSSVLEAPVPPSSSSVQQPLPTSSAASPAKGKDSTIHIVTYVPGSSIVYPDIYEDSVFCWTAGCEKTVKPRSSSSKAKSSSSAGNAITIDEPDKTPPVVDGNTLTDKRDNQVYKLVNVAGKLWMAQDLNYAYASSECYNEDESKCKTNGRLYNYNAAQKVCPVGWRLPSRDEAQAALNDASYPWSYSGRCKDGDCNFLGQMGFHWTSATPQSEDKNFEENKGDSFTVIIVEKEPEYAGDKDQKFFQVDSKTKRFSVRCVQE